MTVCASRNFLLTRSSIPPNFSPNSVLRAEQHFRDFARALLDRNDWKPMPRVSSIDPRRAASYISVTTDAGAVTMDAEYERLRRALAEAREDVAQGEQNHLSAEDMLALRKRAHKSWLDAEDYRKRTGCSPDRTP